MRITTTAASAVLCILLLGCSGVASVDSGDDLDVGEPCTGDERCRSGHCIPYQEGRVCSIPCPNGDECTNGTTCQYLGQSGSWCLPGDCQPNCTDRCCGDDGCGGQCPDICPGDCNTGTCACDTNQECTPEGSTQSCTAHGTCSGTQTCQSDNTWSDCDNAAWECVTPTTTQTCQAGACDGVMECQSDCTWGACQENCQGGTVCCTSGCADLDTDANNCGACANVCDLATQTCYDGACPQGCARNGSEICDDEGFQVPNPPVTVYLVCDNDNGGIAYISTNTGPPCCGDGIPRCQGWEEQGLNAWDYLDYLATLECTSAGLTLQVDLSAYVGQHLHFGAHDLPSGGGHMTMACIAFHP